MEFLKVIKMYVDCTDVKVNNLWMDTKDSSTSIRRDNFYFLATSLSIRREKCSNDEVTTTTVSLFK